MVRACFPVVRQLFYYPDPLHQHYHPSCGWTLIIICSLQTVVAIPEVNWAPQDLRLSEL